MSKAFQEQYVVCGRNNSEPVASRDSCGKAHVQSSPKNPDRISGQASPTCMTDLCTKYQRQAHKRPAFAGSHGRDPAARAQFEFFFLFFYDSTMLKQEVTNSLNSQPQQG